MPEDFRVLIEAGHVDLTHGLNPRIWLEKKYRRCVYERMVIKGHNVEMYMWQLLIFNGDQVQMEIIQELQTRLADNKATSCKRSRTAKIK